MAQENPPPIVELAKQVTSVNRFIFLKKQSERKLVDQVVKLQR